MTARAAPAAPEARFRRLALGALITGLIAMLPLSIDMYAPALPAVTAAFGSDAPTVQLTLSLFAAGFALAQLVYGPLSDRFGRRPVLFVGLVIYGAASVACGFAETVEELLVYRMLQAFGGCAGPVIGRAIVRDLYGREGSARALAFIGAAMGFFVVLAPAIGGYLVGTFGWASVFFLMTGIAVVAFLVAAAILHETNRWRDPGALDPIRLIRSYGLLLRDPEFLGFTFALSLTYCGLFLYLSGGSFVLIRDLGIAPETFGALFGIGVVCYMSSTYMSGRLAHRLGLERLVIIGVTINLVAGFCLAALALAGIATVAAVVAPMCLFMVGLGLVAPNAMAGAIGPHQTMAGTASALFGFFHQGSSAVAAALVGWLFDFDQRSVGVGVCAVTILAFIGFYLLVWCRR